MRWVPIVVLSPDVLVASLFILLIVFGFDGMICCSYPSSPPPPPLQPSSLSPFTESDVHIAGSPFRVYVLPQLPEAATTTASGAGVKYGYTNTETTFTVHARDQYSNLLDRGGAEWYVETKGAWDTVQGLA